MNSFQLNTTNQELKVIPDDYKSENLQALLKSQEVSADTLFKNDMWSFTDSRNSTLDFGRFRDVQPSMIDEERAFANGTTVTIDFVSLIKILYLNEASLVTSHKSRLVIFRSLLVTCHFLSKNSIESLNLKDDHLLYEYLFHQVFYRVDSVKNTIIRGYTPLHYNVINGGWASHRKGYQRTLNELVLSNSIWDNSTVSNAKIDKTLATIIQTASDQEISLSDYKRGASFNYLTLDYGRYYVDHCASYYKDTYVKAMALKETSMELGTFGSKVGYVANRENFANECQILSGTISKHEARLTGARPKYKAGLVKNLEGIQKKAELRKVIMDAYAKHFRFHHAEVEITKPKSIQKIADKLGVTNILQTELEREHITDRLKVIIQSTTLSESCEHTRSLIQSSDFRVQYEEFKSTLKSLKDELSRECIVNYPASTDLAETLIPNKIHYHYQHFIYTTFCAGYIHALGLLGWRQSEYGFPLSSIDISANDDKLDQYFHPLRYKVMWTAPKTGKETLLEREITQDTYHLIQQMNLLHTSETNNSCLFIKIFQPNATEGKSKQKVIRNQTRHMWEHFVKDYKYFKRDDDREEHEKLTHSLAKDDVLSNEEHKKLKRLTKEISLYEAEDTFNDVNLREAKIRLRGELDRVLLAWKLDYELLRKYVSGDLPANEADLIKIHVPQEVLEGVTINSVSNRDVTNTVNNALKSNCIYPSTHAFRHMWAESVYRRFDGDAGWMIRSHFKHISQSMWLAYIRNKDNQIIHAQAKRDVISSLLKNFIKHGGEGYSGKVVPFINRNLKNTHMLRGDGSFDLDAIDDFALSQIADIKSSPWGYCLLQRLNQDKSNCAIGGIPQRFNASPRFCMGCNNFFTHATNVEGILISIASDIKALEAPIPMIFKELSHATVSEAYIHLQKLDAPEDILNDIETSLRISLKEQASC